MRNMCWPAKYAVLALARCKVPECQHFRDLQTNSVDGAPHAYSVRVYTSFVFLAPTSKTSSIFVFGDGIHYKCDAFRKIALMFNTVQNHAAWVPHLIQLIQEVSEVDNSIPSMGIL